MIAGQTIVERFARGEGLRCAAGSQLKSPNLARLHMKSTRPLRRLASIRLIRSFSIALLTASVLALCPQRSDAQSITPVWEYLLNKPSPLPILTNYVAWPDDEENGDG